VKDDEPLFGWASAVNMVIRGERPDRPLLIVGPTPSALNSFGLGTGALTFSVDKIARCRREHPEVSLEVWHKLPELLNEPLAVFPSARRDGSIIVLLLVEDRGKNPIVVAVTSGQGNLNVILSVYGKQNGFDWAKREIALAQADGLTIYKKRDFAASLPQPPVVNTTSSSHGLIPVDGTAKSERAILSIRK
jgi:hypothetical protein